MVALAGPTGSPFAGIPGYLLWEWVASHRGVGSSSSRAAAVYAVSRWLGAMVVIMVLPGSIHPARPLSLTHSVWTPDRPLGTVVPLLLFLLFLISSPSPNSHNSVSSCSSFKSAPSPFVPGIGVFD